MWFDAIGTLGFQWHPCLHSHLDKVLRHTYFEILLLLKLNATTLNGTHTI